MAEISGLPAPNTQPESAIPVPLPSLPELPKLPKLPSLPTPSVSKTTASIPSLKSWAPLYLSKIDTLLTKLSKITSTPSGTDTLLLTLAYTTLLSSNILSKISLARLHHRAHALLSSIKSLPPNTTVLLVGGTVPVSRLAVLAARFKALSVLIGDVRIFARLFGLLGIYAWGKSVWRNGGKKEDGVLRTVAYSQVLVNALFQMLENAAYLGSKGVLELTTKQQNKAWIWSSRYWMAHVLLDFTRLGRERSLHLAKKGDEKVAGDEDDKKWRDNWMRQLVVNSAWLPLTAHWSTGTGIVSEFWIGVFGSVAGITGLRARWRDAGN